MKPGGFKPVPRSGVSLSTAANGNGYIFGGVLDTNEDEENLEGNFSNELHSLDLTSQVWRLQELKQQKAKKVGKKGKSDKAGGSDEVMDDEETEDKATVSTDGVFTMVIGGGSSSATASKVDTKLVAAANIPSPRMKVGLVVVKGTLYLYGGVREEGDKQYTLADFYSLDLHKMDAWKTIIGSDSINHEWMDSDGSDSDDDDSHDEDDDDDDDDSDDSSDEMDTE